MGRGDACKYAMQFVDEKDGTRALVMLPLDLSSVFRSVQLATLPKTQNYSCIDVTSGNPVGRRLFGSQAREAMVAGLELTQITLGSSESGGLFLLWQR